MFSGLWAVATLYEVQYDLLMSKEFVCSLGIKPQPVYKGVSPSRVVTFERSIEIDLFQKNQLKF